MKNQIILIAAFCIVCAITTAQTTTSDIITIITRLNTGTPSEPGCEKRVYSFSDCAFSCALECGGNAFVLSFNMGDIQRVYKDKADMEDTHETLFFECKKGKNCIMSNTEAIPPSPVFPVRLPEDPESTLGEEALAAFQALIAECE